MVKQVPLRSYKYPGMFALVDDEEFDLVMAYVWNPTRKPRKHGPDVFYARRVPTKEEVEAGVRVTTRQMHRLIMTCVEDIDHIDGNGLNNQKSNLRPATQSQNSANQNKTLPTKTSQFRGVHRDERNGKWRASIAVNMRSINLGRFDNEIDAAIARDRAAKHFHGEFARLNFPS